MKYFFIQDDGTSADSLYVFKAGKEPVLVTASQAAAAPELYIAVQLALQEGHGKFSQVTEDALRAALAKAEETDGK